MRTSTLIIATLALGCNIYNSGRSQFFSEADAQFFGEREGDKAGYALASVGDVNGLGQGDDIVIGASHAGYHDEGAAYLVFAGTYGFTSLEEAEAVLIGEATDDMAGRAVAGAGDINRDGFNDILVGAFGNDAIVEDGGAAYLVHGPVSGEFNLADADATLRGGNYLGYAGISVAGNGESNDDGFPDILIGEPHYGTETEGAVYLFHGPVTGDLRLLQADAKLAGEAEGDHAGYSAAFAGDIDADGIDDILVGAYGNDAAGEDAGTAYLVHGPVSGDVSLSQADITLPGTDERDWAGHAVAGAGDTNADGYDDFLVGAPSDGLYYREIEPGTAYLYLGPVCSGGECTPAVVLEGLVEDGWAGFSVAAAGDVNDDLYDDIIIGSPFDNWIGPQSSAHAALFYGPITASCRIRKADAFFFAEDRSTLGGLAVASAGNFSGEGYDSILIGEPGYSGYQDDAGAAYLWDGISLP
ncbi:integrin alpha [Patescibacteria group bacterium]